MHSVRHRNARAVVGAIALVVTGCTARVPPAPSTQGAPASTSVPNPFRVTDRFTPQSLGLKHILSLAIGPSDGKLYVTDFSQAVAVITTSGEVLRRWGSRGRGPGEFRFDPNATDRFDIHATIAVGADGLVYVTDPGNHRIQVFTSQGDFVREVGSFGRAEGQFVNPFDPVVDGAGNLYVADDDLGMVSKFAPDGRFEWRIGDLSGTDPKTVAQRGYPGGVDIHGRLVLTNGLGWVLYVDGSNGHVVDAFDSRSCDVSIDPLGYTYTNLEQDGCRPGLTRVFDRDHHLVGEWSGPDDVLRWSPRFGPGGEAFSVTANGSIVRLDISLEET
jgi:hypothetical protein